MPLLPSHPSSGRSSHRFSLLKERIQYQDDFFLRKCSKYLRNSGISCPTTDILTDKINSRRRKAMRRCLGAEASKGNKQGMSALARKPFRVRSGSHSTDKERSDEGSRQPLNSSQEILEEMVTDQVDPPQSSDPLEVETELAEAEPEPTEEGKSNPSHALSSLAASFRKQLASN
ncbi:hypothetical protein Salat_0181600 [Sesamum alatum]|uniref:Uncharacterized protein n=1 Tax=Sesamum alatum TaxID=300844 RepID=A0AAE1YYV2_9LAMI|nr:hypothetical protein Salat_0181600 [Sesamum alatum]